MANEFKVKNGIKFADGTTLTTSSQTNWDSAYTDRLKWDGGSTGLTASTGRSSLGATTVGSNLFTLTNPSAVTFLRINADNTVSTLDAATFRTAIGAGTSSTTGTVTSVSGTGTVSGLSLSGTVTSSGNITLSGTLSVTPSNFASQTANTVLAAPNGAAGAPTFRALVAADIPTLNQNTTGSAATLTTARTLTIGSTGKTFNGSADVSWSLAEIGAAASSHTHSYLPLAGGTMTDAITFAAGQTWPTFNQNTTGSSGSCTGNAATATSATTATYLTTTQLNARVTGQTNSLAMTASDSTNLGSFVCRATGTGDANLAGMTFWNDSYAIKMGIRADGYIGIGGWSRAAWSWYSDPSGNMVAAGNVTAYSDPRLKENFAKVENPLEILSKLDGGTFNWKRGYSHTECKAGSRDYGILADQVELVMPEIVTESIEIDGEKYKTVAYEKLIPVLIEAIKELKAEIDLLKSVK